MATAITVPIQGTAHDAAYFQLGELTDGDLFVCAYTDGPHAYPVATIAQIRAGGHGILWNHERGQLDLAGGYQAGVTAVSEALAPVIAAGTPQHGSVAIVYSVDGAVAPATFPAYVPAFQAIRAGHAGRFLTGFYGELALYKYLKGLGLVDVKCWLSGSTSFPGYNPNDPDVGLIQMVGTDIPNTDKDLVTDWANLGVWMTQVDLTPVALAEILAQIESDPATAATWGRLGLAVPAEPNGITDPNWTGEIPIWQFLCQVPAQFAEVKKLIAAAQAPVVDYAALAAAIVVDPAFATAIGKAVDAQLEGRVINTITASTIGAIPATALEGITG